MSVKISNCRNAKKQPQERQQENGAGKVKLRTINVLDGIDVVITEDWQNSNGDIVTYTVKPDDDVENLRMLHLRLAGQVLLSIEVTDEQFRSFNSAYCQLLLSCINEQQ